MTLPPARTDRILSPSTTTEARSRGSAPVQSTRRAFTKSVVPAILPIRRLGLEPGESADLEVAYVAVPGLAVEPDGQRYTRLESGGHDEIYRYESLESDFVADLPVDADGLVLDYPGLFRRVRPSRGFRVPA